MKTGIVKKAISEAEKSEQKYGLGAVLFKSSSVFGCGHNDRRASNIPLIYKKFPHSYHAEIAAIYNTSNWNKLKGASIFVIRVNNKGRISKSYPCKRCRNTLKHLGIKNMFYTNREGEIRKERL